jgi:hypothetical protein
LKDSAVEQAASRAKYPLRARIAFALVLAALLLSQWFLVINPVERQEPGVDREMAGYSERFSEVRNLLPRHGLIGYLSDPPDVAEVTQSLYQRRYLSAEYRLAPVVVADSTEPKVILGNFFSRSGMEKATAGRNWVVVRDFHNGVFLLSKEGS